MKSESPFELPSDSHVSQGHRRPDDKDNSSRSGSLVGSLRGVGDDFEPLGHVHAIPADVHPDLLTQVDRGPAMIPAPNPVEVIEGEAVPGADQSNIAQRQLFEVGVGREGVKSPVQPVDPRPQTHRFF